jgi:cytochrome c
MKSGIAMIVAAGALLSGCISTSEIPENRGAKIVQDKCAVCHAVAAADESPAPEAPPFRLLLKQNFRTASLEEALTNGINSGHPAMPSIELTRAEVDAVVAYLQAIQTDR